MVQPPLSLINRAVLGDVVPWAREHGAGVIVYSPMQSGLLTGSYHQRAELAADDWRRESPEYMPPKIERNLDLVERLRPIAEGLGASVSELAIAWVLTRAGVTAAIVGARRPGQVDGWIGAADLELDDAALDAIATAVEESGAGQGPLGTRYRGIMVTWWAGKVCANWLKQSVTEGGIEVAVESEGLSGLVPANLRVRKENTAERAAGVVRDLIVRGEISPGQPLREVELAPALGVSRNTIREALRLLAREALVAPSHRNVYTVVEVSADDVPDIFRMRGMIEFTASEAIQEEGAELDLTEMKAAVEKLKNLSGDVEWWEVVDADLAFHKALVAQAHSPRLSSIYTQLEGEVRLCLSVSTQFQVPLDEIVAEHVNFIELLEKRKYDRFEKALRKAMSAASGRVVGILSTNGDAAAAA